MRVTCRCCGVPVEGPRAERRLCPVCDMCDRRHGDDLQAHVVALLRNGQITFGRALSRMLVDDALLTGALLLIPIDRTAACELRILAPVPRGCVVIGRAIALGRLPDVSAVIAAALARYVGLRATGAVLGDIRRDLIEVITLIDDSVIDVAVTSRTDMLDPGHLIIEITGKSPALGAVIHEDADATVPPDIMSRPRGQA